MEIKNIFGVNVVSHLTILALFTRYPPNLVETHGIGGQTMGDTMDSKMRVGWAAFWYSSTKDCDGLISSTFRYPLLRSTSYTAGYKCLKMLRSIKTQNTSFPFCPKLFIHLIHTASSSSKATLILTYSTFWTLFDPLFSILPTPHLLHSTHLHS